MTIADLFASLLRPCGAAHNPPKSPLHQPPGSSKPQDPNQDKAHSNTPMQCDELISRPNDVTSFSENVVVQKAGHSMSIDCAAIKDKASNQDGSQLQGNQQGEPEENVVVGSERRMAPVEVETADEASTELAAVFGFGTLEGLQSKGWDDRAKAVQSVRERVENAQLGEHSADRFFSAGMGVVNMLLGDRVMPVYLGSLELARLLVVDFPSKHSLPQEVVEKQLDATMPMIVEKTSDRNTRSIEATHAVLIAMARALGCRCVMVHILAPIAANTKETLAIRGRLELLEPMIDEFGFSKSTGVSLSAVMGWVRPHLEAADEKVRHAAVEVTVSCYSHKGGRTSQYVSNLKPALLKLLEQRFAEVDQAGEKKKSKKDKNRRGERKLPALKGQQGQHRMTSRSSCRSTSSSSSNSRQSNSAGSTDGKRIVQLRGSGLASSSPSFPAPQPLASPMSMNNLRSPLPQPDPMAAPSSLNSRNMPNVISDPGGNPQYVDMSGNMGMPGVVEGDDDMLDREDEAFMKELEGLNW